MLLEEVNLPEIKDNESQELVELINLIYDEIKAFNTSSGVVDKKLILEKIKALATPLLKLK